MHLLALFSIALAVSASALPYVSLERGREHNPRENGKNSSNNGDPQTSLVLDNRVICSNFKQNGLANGTAGEAPSLTSQNNYINFCLTVNKSLTNGEQLKDGSCNPAPRGVIPPSTNMPSSKFVSPNNLCAIKAKTTFEIKMAVKHLQTGQFTNADTTYFAAPQQLNAHDDIIGHTHFVVEKLDSITTTTVSDPTKFAFFKGINAPADAQGHVSVNVTNGLPEGVYKLSSINTSANHAPVLVPVAQHGTLDDQVYFFVTADGKRPANID